MHNRVLCFEALTQLFLITASCCFIQALAQFTVFPEDTTIAEGTPLTLNCSFTNAERLFWRQDGDEIESGNADFSVDVDAGTLRLTLRPSADHTVHTGAYECVAVSSGGSESSVEFNITVQYLAVPTLQYEPFQCVEDGGNPYLGSKVVANCVADGEPSPQVTWFYNGVEVRDGEGTFSNVLQNNSQLIITGLNVDNIGHYFCRSENLIGQESSSNTRLGFQTPSTERTIEVVNDVNGIIFAPLDGLGRIDCQVLPPFPPLNTNVESVIFREGGLTVQRGPGYNFIRQPICNVFSLIINNISSIHETDYQCIFESASASTRLMIGMIIPIRASPDFPVIGVGRVVTMTCASERRPGDRDVPQMLAWRFMAYGERLTTDVIPDGQRVTIVRDDAAISANLTIRGVSLEDNGTYICVSFNPDRHAVQVTKEFTLMVEDRPNVTVTPSPTVVRVGTSLLITCSISTLRSSTFLWTVNGFPVTSSNSSYTLTRPLPYESLLNITTVLPKDIGPISCIAEDPLHLPANGIAAVSEEAEPYIVGDGSGVANVDVQINTTLSLTCELRGMFQATPTIGWFLGNRQLISGDGVNVTTGSSWSTLTKARVSLEDDATYLCVVRLGEDTTFMMNFVAFVTIPPMLTEMLPESTVGFEGQRFELICAVAGRPPPRVFWKLSLSRVSELGDPLIRDAGNGSLIFERLQNNHTGIYSCSVEGSEFISDRTSLKVEKMEPVFRVGILNRSETILVFTVCGLVAVLILIATVMLIAVVISCYFMQRSPQGKYTVKHDSIDGAFKRQASLRDNSGIHTSPSNHIFDTLQSPASASSAYNNPYTTGPPTAVAMTTYQGPAPSYYPGGGGPTNSVFSEVVNSHTSTPIHGTMASTSLFGSEEHTSVTAQLPNFPRSNLQLGDVMGEGEFGPVIMGVATNIVPHEERTLVAVKELVPRGEDGEDELSPEVALVDFANQMKLEFANIAVILGMCTDMEPYYVIYEYLDEGDLKKFLINSRSLDDEPPSLTPQHMRKIILQVADGMAYLFSQRIIHGDLATRNCLISSDLRVKIADLGIGHDLYNHDYYDNGSQLLPIRWMPPELLVTSDDGPTFSLHSDIWSFGVFCWEVFSYSRLPYDTMTDEEVLAMVPAGTRLRSPSKTCPPALYDIMIDCWHEIPEERPVFAKLCVAIIGCELD